MALDIHMGIDLAVIDARFASFRHAVKVIVRDENEQSIQGPIVENVLAAAQDPCVDFKAGRSLLGSFNLAYDLPRRIVELTEASP